MKTLREIQELGYTDAQEACAESGESGTPDGGWDSWLINGIGGDAVCRLFECDPERNRNGWTERMKRALAAYHKGACRGADDWKLKRDKAAPSPMAKLITRTLDRWQVEAMLFCAAHGKAGGMFRVTQWSNRKWMAEVPGALPNQAIPVAALNHLILTDWTFTEGDVARFNAGVTRWTT